MARQGVACLGTVGGPALRGCSMAEALRGEGEHALEQHAATPPSQHLPVNPEDGFRASSPEAAMALLPPPQGPKFTWDQMQTVWRSFNELSNVDHRLEDTRTAGSKRDIGNPADLLWPNTGRYPGRGCEWPATRDSIIAQFRPGRSDHEIVAAITEQKDLHRRRKEAALEAAQNRNRPAGKDRSSA